MLAHTRTYRGHISICCPASASETKHVPVKSSQSRKIWSNLDETTNEEHREKKGTKPWARRVACAASDDFKLFPLCENWLFRSFGFLHRRQFCPTLNIKTQRRVPSLRLPRRWRSLSSRNKDTYEPTNTVRLQILNGPLLPIPLKPTQTAPFPLAPLSPPSRLSYRPCAFASSGGSHQPSKRYTKQGRVDNSRQTREFALCSRSRSTTVSPRHERLADDPTVTCQKERTCRAKLAAAGDRMRLPS